MREPKGKNSEKNKIPVCIPYEKCLAKTRNLGEKKDPGRDVFSHCCIVGEIAMALAKRYPEHLRKPLFPPGCQLLAASHDNGKISPTFQEKLRRAMGLPPSPETNPEIEKNWGGHAGVSQVAVDALSPPRFVARILGQHHGFTPQVSGYKAAGQIFGGEDWQAERERLIEKLKTVFTADWPLIDNLEQGRFLAGLISVADWLGSGEAFDDPEEEWRPKIEMVLEAAGFNRPRIKPGLTFAEMFSFSERPAQRILLDQASQPGVYIFEGPMGCGKTEAALYAAYRLMEREQASGIYFALPTQLTSNKIYERFRAFLNQMLQPDSPGRELLLLHANAWLAKTEMGEEGRPGGEWFHQSKRGLLAPFAVGTLDQALLAAMNVKYGTVRAFGLGGKVVILDEVHTYDAYTGVLLDELIALLRRLHCTIFLLSATLSRERRAFLLRQPEREKTMSNAYPLITAMPDRDVFREIAAPADETRQVSVAWAKNDETAIEEVLVRAENGQQVIWLENTVDEAQKRYLDLAARASDLSIPCGLLHSRFTSADRQRLETAWVDSLGKDGAAKRLAGGRILVGTQVLEQSLDIDADFMISRFCPTDMLLQRLGRLWRHLKMPRPAGSACEAWLLAPELPAAVERPLKAFGPSAFVYNAYVLCRSLEVWQGRISLSLPLDIRPLIEATYVSRQETGPMLKWLDELENGSIHPCRRGLSALRQLARVTLDLDGNVQPESKVETRYSNGENQEILLLRGLSPSREQQESRLRLLDGSTVALPWRRRRLDQAGWRQLAAKLHSQLVKVRPNQAPEPLNVKALEKYGLHHCFYLGRIEYDEALLRVALVDEAGVLRNLGGIKVHPKKHPEHILKYRDDIGYYVDKTGDSHGKPL
jgi:CRISPR-associated endonuclease/helicase Cas3